MNAARYALAALALAVGTAACGVPTGGTPDTIPASDVPFGLASPVPTTPPADPTVPRQDEPLVYLLTPDDTLVARGRELSAASATGQLDELLADLADGPTHSERDASLSTALAPTVELTVADVDGGTVTIDISAESPSGRSSRLAVAQIVLTATSLPGVDEVLLSRSGTPVEAPLPPGELTSEPLTAADYEEFLTTPPS